MRATSSRGCSPSAPRSRPRDRPDRRPFDAAAAGADRARCRAKRPRRAARRSRARAPRRRRKRSRDSCARPAFARTSSKSATASISRLSSGREGRRRKSSARPSNGSSPTSRGPSRCAGARGSLRWVRPLHGIVAMLGEEIVPVEIDGIVSRRDDGRASFPPSRRRSPSAARPIMSRSCAPATSSSTRRSASGSSARAPKPRRRKPGCRCFSTKGWWSRMPA